MGRWIPPILDAQKSLFQSLDISYTVKRIQAKYSGSGKGRPRYPVRAMLLAFMLMHLLQIPTVAMLATQLSNTKSTGNSVGSTWAAQHRIVAPSASSSSELNVGRWRESSGSSEDKP